MHIFINNFIFIHSTEQIVTVVVGRKKYNKIREIWGCLLEVLMIFSICLYLSFFVWRNIYDTSGVPYTLSTPLPLFQDPDSQVSHWNSHQCSTRYMEKQSAPTFVARTTLDNFQNRRAPSSRNLTKHRLTPIKFWSLLKI